MKKYFSVLIFGVVMIVFGISLFYKMNFSFGDDYYEVVNEKLLAVNHIEEGEYNWSKFNEAQEKSDEVVEKIIKELVTLDNSNVDAKIVNNMKVVYDNALNWEERNNSGLSSLTGYLEKVNKASNINEFIKVAINVENELGIDIFTRVVVEADYKDNSQNIVYFYPITLAFGSSVDYFVDADYMTYKAYIKRAMIQLLKVYGYDKSKAREVVSDLVFFYEKIGEESKLASHLQEVDSYYNIVSINDIKKVYSNLDMTSYLKGKGILSEEKYSLVDASQYEFINSYLDDEYLELWKYHVIVRVLDSYAMYLGSDYVDVVLELNNSLMGVDSSDEDREDTALDIVSGIFSSTIDSIYEKKVLTEEKKEYLARIVADILDNYVGMLQENEWLSVATKEKAITKVANMKVYIGNSVDNNVIDLGSVRFLSFADGGSLVDNVIEVIRLERLNDLERLANGKANKMMAESVVNAYYNLSTNAIYIPSSLGLLFDEKNDYYTNLGSVGMIIAHEVTHGFDSNGSKFDEKGNLLDWWTESDRQRFEDLQSDVIDYYSRYYVVDGKYIDGEKTVNENIADLGALSCIVDMALDKNASNEEFKQLFSSFAELWVSQEKEEYLKLLLLQDVHAPNKYRVNAVLSSIDVFYDVYNVSIFDDMYVSAENRVSVW